MKPLLKPSSINFCSPHCVFFLRWDIWCILRPWRNIEDESWLHEILQLSLRLFEIWLQYDNYAAWSFSLRCGFVFFFLLFLGITSRGRWSPCFESGNCRKKKNWIRPASQPVNSRWIWVVVQLVFFWKLHSAQDCCLAIRSAFLLVRKLRKPEIFGEASSVKLWLVSWGVEIWFLFCENAWIY